MKKYGIKIYELAESDTGYVHNFEIYTGKNESNDIFNSYLKYIFIFLIDRSTNVT